MNSTKSHRAIFWLGFWVTFASQMLPGFFIAQDCYHVYKSAYTEISRSLSPDGSKVALIFKEQNDGVDSMRHVRIIKRNDSFDPNKLSGTRTRWDWDKEPRFEFSIWRPVELRVSWIDNNNLQIAYPVDSQESCTYQHTKSVSTNTRIHLKSEDGRTH